MVRRSPSACFLTANNLLVIIISNKGSGNQNNFIVWFHDFAPDKLNLLDRGSLHDSICVAENSFKIRNQTLASISVDSEPSVSNYSTFATLAVGDTDCFVYYPDNLIWTQIIITLLNKKSRKSAQ